MVDEDHKDGGGQLVKADHQVCTSLFYCTISCLMVTFFGIGAVGRSGVKGIKGYEGIPGLPALPGSPGRVGMQGSSGELEYRGYS